MLDGRARRGEDAAVTATVLVERTFVVSVAPRQAWELLADVERWPEWAPHIRTARLDRRPLGPRSKGRFTFRPLGSGGFEMIVWDPPHSWTWHGRVLGLAIDYHHRFEAAGEGRTQLTWTVTLPAAGRALRARVFASTYARNLDRAWPRFVSWAEGQQTG